MRHRHKILMLLIDKKEGSAHHCLRRHRSWSLILEAAMLLQALMPRNLSLKMKLTQMTSLSMMRMTPWWTSLRSQWWATTVFMRRVNSKIKTTSWRRMSRKIWYLTEATSIRWSLSWDRRGGSSSVIPMMTPRDLHRSKKRSPPVDSLIKRSGLINCLGLVRKKRKRRRSSQLKMTRAAWPLMILLTSRCIVITWRWGRS